jgi:hypothetical protein
MKMSIESIVQWHTLLKQTPIQRDFDVQLGCHFEEIHEMMETLSLSPTELDTCDSVNFYALVRQTRENIKTIAESLKSGSVSCRVNDNVALLDSLADQIVTAAGVGYRAGYDVVGALSEVDGSNWSKFDEDGMPIFDTNGKCVKGSNYEPPQLERLVKKT